MRADHRLPGQSFARNHLTGFSQFYWFNLFVSAGFGFLTWNYCLTFTAKYIEIIINPFKVAVKEFLGIYAAEIFTIIAQAPLFLTVIVKSKED